MKFKSNQTENHKAISGFLKTLVSYRILFGIKITRLKEPPVIVNSLQSFFLKTTEVKKKRSIDKEKS